jgi:ATP-binding cassette subfamily B protein
MKSLSYLNKYFIKYKWRFLFGIIFTIISNYFGVKMPVYVKDTVDEFMNNTEFNSIENILILSATLGGIYMLLSLLKGFFLFLMRQTIIVMSRFIEFDLKNCIGLKNLYLNVLCSNFGILVRCSYLLYFEQR